MTPFSMLALLSSGQRPYSRVKTASNICNWCGAALEQQTHHKGGRRKEFCSPSHRQSWYNFVTRKLNKDTGENHANHNG